MEQMNAPNQLSETLVRLLAAGDVSPIADLYEERAVFADLSGAVRGIENIVSAHREFLDSGHTLHLDRSVVLEADDIALVHWAWTVTNADGWSMNGVSAEVLRRQPTGEWRFIIDNSDGAALVDTFRP